MGKGEVSVGEASGWMLLCVAEHRATQVAVPLLLCRALSWPACLPAPCA